MTADWTGNGLLMAIGIARTWYNGISGGLSLMPSIYLDGGSQGEEAALSTGGVRISSHRGSFLAYESVQVLLIST